MLDHLKRRFRLWWHREELARLDEEYARRAGLSAESRERYSDTGSFRAQLERLFQTGSLADTGELERMATAALSSTVTNQRYRAADLLSDVIDALEARTYLSLEPEGEPPLAECSDKSTRRLKLETVRESYLVPEKVGAIDTIVRRSAELIGQSLPYRSLSLLERRLASLFSLLSTVEVLAAERRLLALIERWWSEPELRRAYPQPHQIVERALSGLTGREPLPGLEAARVRAPGLPVRLATIEPETRRDFIEAALGLVG